jgi:hypothetical protein
MSLLKSFERVSKLSIWFDRGPYNSCAQIQSKCKSAFDLLEICAGQITQLPFQSDYWERSDALHVCKRLLIEEPQLWKRYLILTTPVLRGQGNIYNQCSRWCRIVARHDNNGPRLRGKPQVREPDFTVPVTHQVCPRLPALSRAGAPRRANLDRRVL